MILKLKDKTEIIITQDEAAAIQKVLEEGSVDFVHIGRSSVSRSLIAGIFEGGLTQADVPNFEQREIDAGKRCRGQYSIQLEINNIAHTEGGAVSDLNPKGVKWSKLIKDKAWREMVRQQLRATGQQWCDYRADECACEPGYKSGEPRHMPSWIGRGVN